MRGTRLELFVFVLVVVLLGGVAFAQDPIAWDPVAWGSNPALAALALAGWVAWLRQTAWGKRVLDGPVTVGATSVISGAVGGVMLEWGSLITVEPYAGLTFPWGGISYGVSLAIFNITGIAAWNYFASKLRPVTVSVAALPETSTQNDIVRFILSLVRGLLPLDKVPEGIKAVAGLVAQFAQSEVVLTDDLRAELQWKVLSLLRKAGLTGADL